jgi:ribose transport system ATP-binding protein
MKDGAVVADLKRRRRTTDASPWSAAASRRNTTALLQKPYRRGAGRGLELGHASGVDFQPCRGISAAGVMSGREELTRTLAGLSRTTRAARIGGRDCRLRTPAEAVDNGFGYIPRERRVEGLVLFLSVAANITLGNLAKLTRHGLIDAREEQRLATTWVERLKVKTPSINALCLNLSGGNQQKVVLAKWLNAQARILILDHPTRGLDVGAKEEVYELVRQVTAEGVAVILTSDTRGTSGSAIPSW